MEKRRVRVTAVGYFDISEDEFKAYEATNFTQALENQKRWFDQGMVDFEELVDDLQVKMEFES